MELAYDGRVKLISGDAHLDLFLFRSFRVSPGLLFYNGNNVNAIVSVPGGQTFSVRGTEYESSIADPIAGSGKINFTKVAPEFTVGTGNLVPRGRRHWSINTEFGFAYTGVARIALGLTDSACEPPFSAGLTCMPPAEPSRRKFRPSRSSSTQTRQRTPTTNCGQ